MWNVSADPGHGGSNGGTASPDGWLVEKDVTLRICKAYQVAVSVLPWFVKCNLTRGSDRTVGLKERGLLTKRKGAKLVYTIHCNRLPKVAADGVRCFYWPGNDIGKAIATAVADAFPGPLRQKTSAVQPANKGPQQNVMRHHPATTVLVEVAFLDDLEDAMALDNPKIIDGIVAALLVGTTEARRLIP